MNSPNVSLGLVSNLFCRMMHFQNVGDIEYGHTHAFDHLTLLAKGSLKVTIDGHETLFDAPQMIFIKKDLEHQLEATKPNTVAYCIHALRDKNVSDDILDPDMLPDHPTLVSLVKQVTNN